MGRILLSLLITLCLSSDLFAVQWNVRKHNGRDHVTMDNVYEFYRFTSRQVSGDNIAFHAPGNRSIRCKVKSNEMFINNVKFILSTPLVKIGNDVLISRMDLSKLIEPVLRPSRIAGASNFNTVVLDPGHGGHDAGARGRWGYEKNFNLDVAKRAKALLERAGYNVVMTRDRDVFIPLAKRAAFANKYRNAIFVSVHFNSSKNRQASGLETYTLAPRGVPSFAQDGPRVSDFHACKGNMRDAENIALATAMHSALLSRVKMPDRGIKRARFVVIRDVIIPGVLLEGGFVSNSADGRKIASSGYRQMMAYAITDAVRNYKVAVNGGRPMDVRNMGVRAGNPASATISPLDGPKTYVPRVN